MKNKIYYYIALFAYLAGFSLLTSCMNDGSGLLDKAETEDITEARLWANANYAGQFLTDIYARMRNGWMEEVYLDSGTDLGEARPWWGWTHNVHNGAFNANSMPSQLNRWAEYYAAIRACNQFIAHIDAVTPDPNASPYGGIINEEIKKRRKAECYALRGFFYGELLRCYGGVPIINKVLDLNSPELYSSRNTVEEVVNQVIADCDQAIPGLPFRATGTEYPRMTVMVAKAIKSRALLIAASPIFNDNVDSYGNAITDKKCPFSWGNYDKERWKKAADAALDAINYTSDPTGAISGAYGLYSETDNTANYNSATTNQFAAVGTSCGASAKSFGWYRVFITPSNSEMLMVNPYKGQTNQLEKWQMPGFFDLGGDRCYTMPSMNYAALFENKDGIPVYVLDDDNAPIIDPATKEFKINPAANFNPQKFYENRDNRFYHSLWYQGTKYRTFTIDCWYAYDGRKGPMWNNGYPNMGLFLRKFLDPITVSLDGSHNITGQTSHRYPLFRYVELLLNYAEAMNEYLDDGADRSLVIAQMDKIRARADMPDVATTFQKNGWSTTNKAQMRKFIRRERTIELAFEDNRYYDVKRWKIGNTQKLVYKLDTFLQQDGTIKYTVIVDESRMYQPAYNLFPIPLVEIKNNPNLVQNPGW